MASLESTGQQRLVQTLDSWMGILGPGTWALGGLLPWAHTLLSQLEEGLSSPHEQGTVGFSSRTGLAVPTLPLVPTAGH